MRIIGPGKRVGFAEPVVEVEIFPDGAQRDGFGREIRPARDEVVDTPLGKGGRALMPFGVRRPPAGVLVDGDDEVGVADLNTGELLSDDLNTLDYYDVYPMRKMLRRVHVQDRRQQWIPTDSELPVEWAVDDLEDWSVTRKQYPDGRQETKKGKYKHMLEKTRDGLMALKGGEIARDREAWRGETWIYLKGSDLNHTLEMTYEPEERRLLERGEILIARAGQQTRGPEFAPDSALCVEREELIRAQRECRELKIFAALPLPVNSA